MLVPALTICLPAFRLRLMIRATLRSWSSNWKPAEVVAVKLPLAGV